MCRGAEKRAPPLQTEKRWEKGGRKGGKKQRSLAKGGGLSEAGIREAPPGSFRGASYSGYRSGLPLSGGPG